MSRANDKKNTKSGPKVKLEDVWFYFDGVERDRLDAAGVSRKSSEVLALRERLLKLPDEDFAAAMKAVRALVDDAARPEAAGEGAGDKRRRASTLYDGIRRGSGSSGGTGGTSKVAPP